MASAAEDSPQPTLAVIAERSSQLSAHVADEAREANYRVEVIPLDALATERLEVRGPQVWLRGRQLDGVLSRLTATAVVASSFVEADRSFCAIETKAMWLAVSNSASVAAVNRHDEDYLFGRSEWATWHQRFDQAGLGVAPLTVSSRECPSAASQWLPWSADTPIASQDNRRIAALFAACEVDGQVERWTACYGKPVDGCAPEIAHSAARVLSNHGCNLGTILVNEHGLIGASSQDSSHDTQARQLAPLIVEGLDAALGR